MRNLLWILLVALGGCAGVVRGTIEDGASQRTEKYLSYIAEGERRLDEGDPVAAFASFKAADSVELVEVPNYEALVHVAEAQCLSGALDEGLATLMDFRCAVSVDAGETPCFIGDATSDAPGSRNPALTNVCFQRMCGELFLSYYEGTDPEKERHLKTLRQRAEDVAEICSAQ